MNLTVLFEMDIYELLLQFPINTFVALEVSFMYSTGWKHWLEDRHTHLNMFKNIIKLHSLK